MVGQSKPGDLELHIPFHDYNQGNFEILLQPAVPISPDFQCQSTSLTGRKFLAALIHKIILGHFDSHIIFDECRLQGPF